MGRAEPAWRQAIAPLGIPTLLIADDPDLLATACAAYADWPADMPDARPAIEIRLETSSAPSTSVSCGIEVKGSRLQLTGHDYGGHADAASMQGRCMVPRRLVGAPDALAAEVTDTLLLFLLTRSGRTPLHAAGIMLGDAAVVLMGPTGTGKSTLALAAARRGMRVLSDETVYVQFEPGVQVWGMPRPIHVFPESAPGIEQFAIRSRGAKRKAIVPLPRPSRHTGPVSKVLPVVLERGARLELVRIDAESAREALPPLDPGFDMLPVQSAVAYAALLARGAWRLTLARDAEEAFEFLVEKLSETWE